MKRVTIQFQNEMDLRNFVRVTNCIYVEMNENSLTIICECDEAEIELAEKGFHANVTHIES